MFSFPSFGFKLFVVSVLVSNLLVFSVSSFSESGTEIFSWIEFRIDVFQAVVCGTVFSTIPAGLPGPGALSLGYSFALFIFAEEAQYNLARNVRLKNSETGVLGTRKIGTGEYCCVTRVQFWRWLPVRLSNEPARIGGPVRLRNEPVRVVKNLFKFPAVPLKINGVKCTWNDLWKLVSGFLCQIVWETKFSETRMMSESTQQSRVIQLQLESERPSIHYNDSSITTLNHSPFWVHAKWKYSLPAGALVQWGPQSFFSYDLSKISNKFTPFFDFERP